MAHAVGRAVGRQCGDDVARRLRGFGQCDFDRAIAVGLVLLVGQFNGEFATVIQVALGHAEVLCAQGDVHFGVFDRFAVGIAQLQFGGDVLIGFEFVFIDV